MAAYLIYTPVSLLSAHSLYAMQDAISIVLVVSSLICRRQGIQETDEAERSQVLKTEHPFK